MAIRGRSIPKRITQVRVLGPRTIELSGLSGSVTPGSTVPLTSIKATQVGSSTPSGLITLAVTKATKAGSTTPTSTVAPTIVKIIADRTGSSTPTGTVTPRVITKNLTGLTTPNGDLPARTVSKATLLGSTTPTSSAPPAHIINLPLASTITPAGSVAGKQITKAFTGSLAPSGSTGPKQVTYLLTSALAPSGHLVPQFLPATAIVSGPPKALPNAPIIWSYVTWKVDYLPEGASVVVETSVNNGASWQVATNGRSVPLLKPRSNVVKTILWRITLRKANGTAESPIVSGFSIDADSNTTRAELVPCGSFLITDTTVTDGPDGVEIELSGMDLSLRLQENAWERVKTFPAGTNMGEVIKQAILDRDQSAKFEFSDTQMVAPATLTFGAGASNNPLADVMQCATFCGMELFVNYQGYYVLQTQPDPEIDPVVYTFSDRARPVMTRVMRRLTRTESFNYIVVSGEATGTTAPVSASTADNDPRSPTYYLGPGGKRVKRVVSKLVKSVGDALTMAQGLLLKLKGAGETVEISAVPNPSLLEGDTVLVDRAQAGLNARYLLDAFTINFAADADMPFAGRRQKLDKDSASNSGGVGGLDGNEDTSGEGGGGGGGTVLRTYQTPGECLKIGTNGNLNHYKIQTAFSGGSSIVEKSQAQIGGGYAVSPEFCMSADKTAVQMRVNFNAPTTSGSSNPRSELREMDSNGTSNDGWSPSSGTHICQSTFRLTKLPNSAKRVSCMQIHDTEDDVLQIKTEVVSGQLKIGYNKNGGSFVALDNYALNDWVTVRIQMVGNTVSLWYHPGTDPTFTGSATTSFSVTRSGNCYFKVGCYPQGVTSESSSDHAMGEWKKLGTSHPGSPPMVFDSDTISTGGGGTPITQALGVRGTPTPAPASNVVLATSDSTGTLSITTSGTASQQRIYDGQGHFVKKIDIDADYVTVQNYYVKGGASNSGIYSIGTGNIIQNNDISEVAEDGTGDINGITFFGDDTQILFNKLENLVFGSPGGSHTDGIQTWNTPSKRSSSNVLIYGNRISGPVQSDPKYIHQGVMAEGKDSTDGGGGGTGVSSTWLIDRNYFKTYGNQALGLRDIDNVKITRNTFAGSATKIVESTDGAVGNAYYSDNIVTGSYGSVGLSTTSGAGPNPEAYGYQPPAGSVDPVTFTFAYSSCIDGAASGAGSLTHIKNAAPDYFAVLGDFFYKDGQTPNWVADWNTQVGYSNFANLIAALPNPIIVSVSDHDFGYNNNATGVGVGSTHVNNFNSAYRTKWGASGTAGVQNATLPSTGIYRTWVVGRVRFVLLDMLSFKSTLSATDNSSKTMLGATQKAWYKNILATASEPLIVVLGDGQIPGPTEAGQDEWRGYNTERVELQNALNASPRKILYLNGDTHSLATASNQYGYDRCWQSAPLHNVTKVKAGGAGYSQQYPNNSTEGTVKELYAIITFTDTGSAITATYKGYEGTTVRLTDTITVTG